MPDRVGPGAKARFRSNDRYRAEREWARYAGTPQRDLFRDLRTRFLGRHPGSGPLVLDAGAGPGRLTPFLGNGARVRRIALDIGDAALRALEDHWPAGPLALPMPDRVRGDALHPPFGIGTFGLVAGLGNLVGFAEDESDTLLGTLLGLVRPGGSVVLEIAPGPGEVSRYLSRLPTGVVARLFRSPVSAVVRRVLAEGFRTQPRRRASPTGFRRFDPEGVAAVLDAQGFSVEETLAIAPALGTDAERVAAIARDPKAWGHLLDSEESIGRRPERWTNAAAVLVAGVRAPAKAKDKVTRPTDESAVDLDGHQAGPRRDHARGHGPLPRGP